MYHEGVVEEAKPLVVDAHDLHCVVREPVVYEVISCIFYKCMSFGEKKADKSSGVGRSERANTRKNGSIHDLGENW